MSGEQWRKHLLEDAPLLDRLCLSVDVSVQRLLGEMKHCDGDIEDNSALQERLARRVANRRERRPQQPSILFADV